MQTERIDIWESSLCTNGSYVSVYIYILGSVPISQAETALDTVTLAHNVLHVVRMPFVRHA